MDKIVELKKRVEDKLYEIDSLEKNDFTSYLYFASENNFLDALEWVLTQIDELMEVEGLVKVSGEEIQTEMVKTGSGNQAFIVNGIFGDNRRNK